MNVNEGKQPIAFAGYGLLCKKFIAIHAMPAQMSFAWSFFTLCWNLFARANSVANIMLPHMSWRDDSLIVVFTQHKGDKEGQHSFGRHVYANPVHPELCPILALAVLIFSKNHYNTQGRQQLFEGKGPEDRFSDALQKVVDPMSDAETMLLGRSFNFSFLFL